MSDAFSVNPRPSSDAFFTPARTVYGPDDAVRILRDASRRDRVKRFSEIEDPAARADYHSARYRAVTTEFEALTPGVSVPIPELPLTQIETNGKHKLKGGAWDQCIPAYVRACGQDARAVQVMMVLWELRDKKLFERTGRLETNLPTQSHVAARCGGITRQTVSRAAHRLCHEHGVLTRVEYRHGTHQPIRYLWAKQHNGMWETPLGSKSATRNLLARELHHAKAGRRPNTPVVRLMPDFWRGIASDKQARAVSASGATLRELSASLAAAFTVPSPTQPLGTRPDVREDARGHQAGDMPSSQGGG